jgi:hypothetical protein
LFKFSVWTRQKFVGISHYRQDILTPTIDI